ncbi:Kinesin-like protein kif22 [Tyrophagus putrescentiae]|nr:Kinesin-like protein kif22 [Tyrophagus putrescentiae]
MYKFDAVFSEKSTQEEVFTSVCPFVENYLSGSDSTLLTFFLDCRSNLKQRLTLASLGSPRTPADSDLARSARESLVGGRSWWAK